MKNLCNKLYLEILSGVALKSHHPNFKEEAMNTEREPLHGHGIDLQQWWSWLFNNNLKKETESLLWLHKTSLSPPTV